MQESNQHAEVLVLADSAKAGDEEETPDAVGSRGRPPENS